MLIFKTIFPMKWIIVVNLANYVQTEGALNSDKYPEHCVYFQITLG